MLGLVYTIIISIGLIVHFINEYKENKNTKHIYKHKNGLTYVDLKGNNRLLSNNKLVFYVHNKNGDYVLEDEEGNVYKNFSEEEKTKKLNNNKEKALKNNKSTYCLDDDSHKNDFICKGKRFVDLETGDIYVIRYINYKYYYMNIVNGQIVRKTDWQIKRDEAVDKKTYLQDDLNIEEFNNKQKNIENQALLFRNFDYFSSCDYYK